MKRIIFLFGMLACWTSITAQDTITTSPPLTPNNGQSGVTFEVESSQPVNIIGLDVVFSTATSANLWMRIGGVQHTTGSAPNITAANGWTQVITNGTVTGANSNTPVPLDFGSTKISIPPNTRIGFFVDGLVRYQTGTASDPTLFTDGVISVIVDDNASYGGGPPSPTFNPRRFLGSVIYELGVVGNCTAFTDFAIDSITATGAKVDWTPGSGNSSFFLEYGTTGFTPGSAAGTKITGTYPGNQPPVILSNLTSLTGYDVYFGEICNSGADSVYFPTPQQFSTTNPCTAPTNFTVSNVSTTSADFNWNILGTVNNFEIIYGTAGFNPLTGGSSHIAASSPTSITTLTGSTDYEAYLIADCGGVGVSDTVGPISFRTPCVIATAPFTETFDGPSWIPGTSSTIDPCWTTNITPSTTSWSWNVFSSGPTSGNGPTTDHTGGNFMYVEGSYTSAQPAELITPPIDVSGLTTPALYFMQHRYSGGTIADMLIQVTNDGGTTWDSVYHVSGDIQQSSSDPWILEFVNLTNYTGDTIMVKFAQFSNGCCGDAAIDSVVVAEAPLCPWPTGFGFDRSTTTTANVSWNDPSGSSWDLEWGPVGFNQGTGSVTSTSSNPYTITGLAPGTAYDVYLRANCASAGNGVSIWMGPLQLQTQCSPFTAPYSTNFDSYPANVVPDCWQSVNHVVGTTKGVVETYTFTTPYSTPNHLRMYNGSATNAAGDTVMLVSPEFSDLTLSDKRINFFAKASTAGTQLIIGTMPQYDAAGAFNPIDTIILSTTHSFYQVEIDAGNGYNGTDTYIGLFHANTATFRTIFIDDFKYEEIPACVGPLIVTLGVDAVTATSANVYWDGGQGDYTLVEWGPVGFIPGSGNQIGSTVVPGSDTVYTITGLSAQTDYEFYVVDTCTASGMGAYVGPISFTTACTPVTAPYIQDFENHTVGWYQGVENCWTIENSVNKTSATSGFGWDLRNTPQTSSGTTTGAAGDATLYPNTGGNFFNADVSYGSTGAWSALVSPLVDVSALTNPEVRYNIHRYGSIMAEFHVDIFDGSQWHLGVHSYTSSSGMQTSQADAYTDTNISLVPYLGSSNLVRARFRTVSQGCCAGDNSLDDISFVSGPTCPPTSNLHVSGLTDTQANLKWFKNPGASGFEVWYGPDGFFQGTQTVGGIRTVVTDSLALSGLNPNTCYEFLVRVICGPNDTSSWAGPLRFCTFCTNQLNGTYTVGGATGPMNFPTLDSAVSILNSCGVSGPVTFNLSGGIHNPIHIMDIPGSNATNTVTINASAGGDSIISSTGTAIELDEASFVSFNDLYIKSSSGFTVWLHNEARDISFDNCIIENSRTATSATTAVVAATASATSASMVGNNASNLSINNCTIAGGYYGVTVYGISTTSHVKGLSVTDCHFEDVYFYGLRSYYMDSVQIRNNHFEPFRNTSSGYGLYVYYSEFVQVTGNIVEEANTYAVYSYYTNNSTGSASRESNWVNNMFNSNGTYGLYMYGNSYTNLYHNTIQGGTYGMYLSGPAAYDHVDIRNNIFTNNGTYPLYILTEPANFTLDYNLYHNYGGPDIGYQGGTAYSSLTAWRAAITSDNANSVTGDPVFISSTDLHVLGSVANDAGDNSVGVTVDVDGDPRPAPGSTIVDIGADEYTPVAGDLSFIGGDFIKGLCLSNNDSIMLEIHNLIGSAVDFSIDPLTITYDVTGPANTSGTITVNSGTLSSQDTLVVYEAGIDLSIPGSYTLSAYIDSNAVNVLAFNDTLTGSVTVDVKQEFAANPKTYIMPSANDSLEICIESSFFGGGTFFISEVCHFKTTTGAPTGGWPSYLLADDYLEITGRPGADLEGITLEQWSTTALMNTHTFPAGTVLGPDGTAIIAIGQPGSSTPSPANFYYHGNTATTFSSGGSNGRILKDASGDIIDAVGYGVYTFPAASGVTAADWSGSTATASGTCGIRLIGPDNNAASNWVVSSATNPQDPNVLNPNVPVPNPTSAAGFTWTYNNNVVDTVPCMMVGPFTSGGVYQYIANYTNPCGTFTDTVTVIVPLCSAPSGLGGSALSGSSVQVTWDSTGTGAASFDVEYGPAGFSIGSGTRMSASGTSATVTGLAANICQDFYLRASCSAIDTSAWIGPISLCPDITLCTDDFEQYPAGDIAAQSALFAGWYGMTGGVNISTAQASSGSQSIYIPGDGIADIVAWFDTIDSGTWNFKFDIYVPTGTEAYYNFQRNYTHGAAGQTNAWAFDVNYLANGTATVDGGSYGGNGVASFTYTQGQWNTIEHIIDFTNDTVFIMVNGTPTTAGWTYSFGNMTVPIQANGINFYSNPNLINPDYYVDDICIEPYVSTTCPTPTGLAMSAVSCDTAVVSWTSTSGSQSTILEYGPLGFTPMSGQGTVVNFINSPYTLTGLNASTDYDVYIMDTCGTTGDSSAFVGPVNFTTAGGPVASFTSTLGNATASGLTVNFNGSASTGASVFSWDFGDGNFGSGASPANTYTANGTYIVTLTVMGACGTDSIKDTIVIQGISLQENDLARSLQVYPNPTTNVVNVGFEVAGSDAAEISVMDLSGKIVLLLRKESRSGRIDEAIDLGPLADGTYMLKIESGGTTAIRRIVKQ